MPNGFSVSGSDDAITRRGYTRALCCNTIRATGLGSNLGIALTHDYPKQPNIAAGLPQASQMTSLASAGIHAVKWSVLTTVARFVLQLGAQVVLARLLGPANYGIFGIGMVVLTLSNFLANFGFGWNLLHKQVLTTEDIRFAFTWQVIAGATAMVALFLLAPVLADYFREPKVLPVIRWLSLSCMLGAAAAPASSLLQRDLNFKAVGLVQVGSYASGYLLIGIPMALAGLGVNSLVAAWLVQAVTALVATYAIRPHSLLPLVRFSGSGQAMGVSGQVFVTNVINWCLNNADRVFIGRMLNAHAVGVYTAGYNLATLPNSLLLGTLQPAFMSAAARVQSEPQRLGRMYVQMLATLSVLALPFFVFLAALSFDIVGLLYGPLWADTASVLSVLFLGMPAYVAWGITTPVLWNTGRKHHEALLQLPVLLLGIAALYGAMQWGVLAVAVVASSMLVLRMVVVCASAFQVLGLRFSELVPHITRGMLLSATCLAVVGGSRWAVGGYGVALVNILVSGTASSAVFLFLVRRYPNFLGRHAAEMLIRFIPKLSQFFIGRRSRHGGGDV
jgi:O-antigen/teichoic acid export membrane protein